MRLISAIRGDKYYLLLFMQLLFFGILPVLDEKWSISNYLLPVLLSLILISALRGIGANTKFTLFGVLSSVAFIISVGTTNFKSHPLITLGAFLLFVSLYIFVIYKIIEDLLSTNEVKASLIAGALTGYLMIGVILSFFFLMLDAFDPQSLSVTFDKHSYAGIVYFSLVTMTTIGYGDIVPINQTAQIVSAFGAIASQFYLAVVVAVLVGKMMNNSKSK